MPITSKLVGSIVVVAVSIVTPADAAADRGACAASGGHPNYFEANVDVYGGNSGSPVAAPGRQGGHMTVLEDYERASAHGVVRVESGAVLRPVGADVDCGDVDEDGRVGLIALRFTLSGAGSEPVVAIVAPVAGEIDESGRHDVVTRFDPDSGLAEASGTIRITWWGDDVPPGPRR